MNFDTNEPGVGMGWQIHIEAAASHRSEHVRAIKVLGIEKIARSRYIWCWSVRPNSGVYAWSEKNAKLHQLPKKTFKSTANKKKHQVDGVQVYERCTNDRDWKTSRNFLIRYGANNKQSILFFTCFLSFSVRQPKAGLQRAHEQQQKKKSMSP